ncbi:dCTP deaminase [Methylophilus sp. 3sh_L]|uniref:dCTP deaminase n=1 Tax=Methylophilus sp. 3sh_L TaxID=3377114 RepID=UPI00398F483A
MSALSKKAIEERLSTTSAKKLTVSPILDRLQIGPSSIDLRMGNVVMVAKAGGQSHVEPAVYKKVKDHDCVRYKQQKHERVDIPFGKPFLLHPGTLALVPTLEWVHLPLDLQGIVTARSSWAREGLNIATATIVNPDYRGIITLELANFGEIPIELYPGLRLAQIAFYLLDDAPTEGYVGQFKMSFEPAAGDISQDDDYFIPVKENRDKSSVCSNFGDGSNGCDV